MSFDSQEGIGCARASKAKISVEQRFENEEKEVQEVDKTSFVENWLSNVSSVDNADKESVLSSHLIQTQTQQTLMTKLNRNGNKFIKPNKGSTNSSKTSSKSNPSLEKKKSSPRINFPPAGYNANRSISSGSKSSLNTSYENVQQQPYLENVSDHGTSPKCGSTKTSNITSSACTDQKQIYSNEMSEDWQKIIKRQTQNDSSAHCSSSDLEKIRYRMKKDLRMCTCKLCEVEFPVDLEYNTENFAQPKQASANFRPSPLLKTSDEQLSSVMTKPAIKPTAGEVMCYSKLLVHGRTIPHPQSAISDTNLIKPIQDRLRTEGYERSMPVQSYGWQGIMRGNNVCIIHSHKTGKTLTYIAAISSFLIDDEGRYDRIPQCRAGPMVIVLTNTSKVAEEVHQKFVSMLQNSKMKDTIWMPILPLNQKEINARYGKNSRRTNVIITTLDTLIVFLSSNIFDLKRLCHFVVENVDIVLHKFQQKFQLLLTAIDSMLQHRNSYAGVQFICTGEKWTLKLEQLIAKLNNFPLIIIGNPMQAALYGRADFQLKYIATTSKSLVLTDLLVASNYKLYKCIVVCKLNEIDEIENTFAHSGICFITTSENMLGLEVMSKHNSWMTSPNGKHLVLISTDKVLRSYLYISNANFLVNYSLPPTWSIFSGRFFTLVESYMCPLTSTFNQNKYNCKIITFVDEECIDRFPRISNFFTFNRMQVPDRLLQYCNDFQRKREIEKVDENVKLCKFVKTFGECRIQNCKDRHIFSKCLDAATLPPFNGQIKGKLVIIKQPNHYFLRILEYKDLDGNTHQLEDHVRHVNEYLARYTGFDLAPKIEKGHWYLYCHQSEIYRCVVERVEEYVTVGDTTTDRPLRVEIFGLDNAIKMVTYTDVLYTLPDELKTVPQSVTEVIVAKLIPPFKESMWTVNASKSLQQQLRTFNRDAADCVGNILLRLDGIIWVDNLQLKQMRGPLCKRFSLCTFLKQHELFEESQDTLEKLYKLCADADIELVDYKVLKYDVPQVPKPRQSQPSWAHLERDELNSVYFSFAASADIVFIRHRKFADLLKQLEDDITKRINLLFRKLSNDEIIPGHYYALMDDASGNYCRILLTEIVDDMAKCFYVDYGDSITVPTCNLKLLDDIHLTRLPFQAIECSMYGLAENTSSQEFLDALYDYSFGINNEGFKTFYAMHMAEEIVQTKHVAITKYKIILLEYCSGQSNSINQMFIDSGLAQSHQEESLININLPELQQIPDVPLENEENDDGNESDVIPATNVNDKVDEYLRFNEADFDLFCSANIDDMLIRYSQNTEASKVKPGTVPKPEQTKPEYMPMKVGKATSDKWLPRINWHQNNSLVFLEFMFSENNDYKVQIIRNRFLKFSTVYNGKNYELNVNLFHTVRKNFTHESKTHFISVIFTKEKKEEWLRLVKSEEPMRNIKYKTEKIEVSDSEEEDNDEFGKINIDDIDPKCFDHVEVSPDGRVCEFYSDYDDSESDYDDNENKYD